MRLAILTIFCISIVSCAPQHARRVTYSIGNSYSEVKTKLTDRQNSQVEENVSFTGRVVGRVTVSAIEVVPNNKAVFVKKSYAIDMGTVPEYEATLYAKSNGSRVVVKELKGPFVYDGARWFTRNKLGNLKVIDSWIEEVFDVESRVVDEDLDSAPLYLRFW